MVEPQSLHFRQVPFLTILLLPQSSQMSPVNPASLANRYVRASLLSLDGIASRVSCTSRLSPRTLITPSSVISGLVIVNGSRSSAPTCAKSSLPAYSIASSQNIQSTRLEAIFTLPLPPSTIPLGSNFWNVNTLTKASKGTPCCSPIETAIANWLSMALHAAPSFEVTRIISPSRPSGYSPVINRTLCPPILAFTLSPFFLSGSARLVAM